MDKHITIDKQISHMSNVKKIKNVEKTKKLLLRYSYYNYIYLNKIFFIDYSKSTISVKKYKSCNYDKWHKEFITQKKVGEEIIKKILDFEMKLNATLSQSFIDKYLTGKLPKKLIDTYMGIDSKFDKTNDMYKVLKGYTFGETLKLFFKYTEKEQFKIIQEIDVNIYKRLKYTQGINLKKYLYNIKNLRNTLVHNKLLISYLLESNENKYKNIVLLDFTNESNKRYIKYCISKSSKYRKLKYKK